MLYLCDLLMIRYKYIFIQYRYKTIIGYHYVMMIRYHCEKEISI